MNWYPFNFIRDVLHTDITGDFDDLTGLTTALGSASCPMPDFPIEIEYLDTTQKFSYDTPMLERRIKLAHRLPRRWSLKYPYLDAEALYVYMLPFFQNHGGNWTAFNFIDPDRVTFSTRNFTSNPLVLGEPDFIATARFEGNFKPRRETKNFYSLDVTIMELF